MTHAQLVTKAVHWLRRYRCGVVLSEQACVSGEMPDAIGWKRACHSVLVECKVTRSDFLADRAKPFRMKPEQGVGSERFYLVPAGLVGPVSRSDWLVRPSGWVRTSPVARRCAYRQSTIADRPTIRQEETQTRDCKPRAIRSCAMCFHLNP